MRGRPFAAAITMMSAIAAVMVAAAGNFALQQSALAALGPYKGRGKGKTQHHDRGGTRAYQRAALKKRNRAAHRKACRG